MLKIASSGLGMAPAQAMRTAEGLYTSGYLSYPRTGTMLPAALSSSALHAFQDLPNFQVPDHTHTLAESSAYPPGFDFQEVLVEMRRHPIWGEYAQHLMGTFTPPKVELSLPLIPP